ncbi:hypothetical protein LTR84_009364 [Exophiala bonariae]|uniref:FAS1 domain-containing protein n=1 Tax=Exophiala bonariae TaxID=1690606 RepID=A0AAV9MUY3_9EURO|nr:hypothetical protein LTR84_009364 [Exophiala bonariae]
MAFGFSLFALCVAFSAFVTAQDLSITDALKGHAELSNLTYYLTKSQDFVTWLGSRENITLLAPNNQAFKLLAGTADIANVEVDQDGLEALLKYHLLNGTYSTFGSGEYESIPSLLEQPDFTNVTGGQVVVAKASATSNTTRFYSGLKERSFTVGSAIQFKSGIIHVIDNVLTLPQTFTDTAEDRLFLVAEPFADAQIAFPDSAVTKTLDELSDITVFLPMNHSVREVGNLIEKMNRKDFDRMIAYHTLDQRLVIEPEAPPAGTYKTLEGSDVTIFQANGHVFVNSARIVSSPDWLFTGGVIYIIDGVLNPDNRTVDQNAIQDSQIAYTGASYTEEFEFPAPSQSRGSANNNGSGTGSGSDDQTSESKSSGGLSKGAKIGIAVAAAVVGLVLIGALVAFLFMRRRRVSSKGHQQLGGLTRPEYPMSEFTPSQKDLTSDAAAPGSSRY